MSRGGQFPGRDVLPPAWPIGPNKVGITEPAYGARPILFPATPEIASSKAAEDSGPSGVGAFALKGVEKLFDVIGHG